MLDNNQIFFRTSSFFDSGNTYSSTLGYYLVDTTLSDDIYIGENKNIALSLKTISEDEIELSVSRRIVQIDSQGIINVSVNSELKADYIYCFKKVDSISENFISEKLEAFNSRVDQLGIAYGDYIIQGADVFWRQSARSFLKPEVRKVEILDNTTFKVLEPTYRGFYLFYGESLQMFSNAYTDYAKDAKSVYYQGLKIKGLDPYDFQIVDHVYAKSSKHIYYMDSIIDGADVESFSSINGGYAKDKKHYYYKGKVVKKDKNIKKLLLDEKNLNTL